MTKRIKLTQTSVSRVDDSEPRQLLDLRTGYWISGLVV